MWLKKVFQITIYPEQKIWIHCLLLWKGNLNFLLRIVICNIFLSHIKLSDKKLPLSNVKNQEGYFLNFFGLLRKPQLYLHFDNFLTQLSVLFYQSDIWFSLYRKYKIWPQLMLYVSKSRKQILKFLFEPKSNENMFVFLP